MQTFSEWISNKDRIAREWADHLLINCKANYKYDIPYLAGYSKDGKTFYIDKDVPSKIKYNGKSYDLHVLILRHEAVEKAAMMKFKLGYEAAHAIALKAERDKVEEIGIPWKFYDAFCQKWIKSPKVTGRLKRIPKDLDMTPYLTYHAKKDKELVARMKELMQ